MTLKHFTDVAAAVLTGGAIAFSISYCEVRAQTRVDVTRDRMGNVYPPECRRDLAADSSLNILTIRTDLPKDLGGVTHPALISGRAMIMVSRKPQPFRGMSDTEVDADNIQHERCHALLLLLGKDPHWHR